MIQITFNYFKGGVFARALGMAEALGGALKGERVELTIFKKEIFEKQFDLQRLLMTITQDKFKAEVKFQGKEYTPMSIVLSLRKIGDCLRDKIASGNDNFCGWGCKNIELKLNDRELFLNIDDWMQHMHSKKEEITEQAEKEGWFLCPIFDETVIERALQLDQRRVN